MRSCISVVSTRDWCMFNRLVCSHAHHVLIFYALVYISCLVFARLACCISLDGLATWLSPQFGIARSNCRAFTG